MIKKVTFNDLVAKMEDFLEEVAKFLGIEYTNQMCLFEAFQQMHRQLTVNKKYINVNEPLLTTAEVGFIYNIV